ncbi:MAG: PP2C family protein-serine/threonine phosphatase, partial [Cyanobacteria bacterium P01_A01_bin.135]
RDIWLAVGDVSGKGVPAALLMASAISVLRRELSQDLPLGPDAIMQRLNHSLMDSLVSSNCLITMVLARYSPERAEITYANAGHVYPVVWSRKLVAQHGAGLGQDPATPQPDYLQERGVPLGIAADWQARAGRRSLLPGDVLMLVSDGITEATVPSDNGASHQDPDPHTGHHKQIAAVEPSSSMLRHSGLWKLILQHHGAPDVDVILHHIQSSHIPREDDQTILTMEVL